MEDKLIVGICAQLEFYESALTFNELCASRKQSFH